MKVLALLCFRNESKYKPIFLSSLEKFCDGFVGYDDGSEDDSGKIFTQYGGFLLHGGSGKNGRGATIDIRQKLLENGRKLGGTHFIVADCDEIFAIKSDVELKQRIIELQPREKLALNLVNLWGMKAFFAQKVIH